MTLNETLASLGLTKRKNGVYRHDVMRGSEVLLEAATASEVWAWLKECNL